MIENFCNVIVTNNGLITENILVVGENVGSKIEKIFIKKAKEYSTSIMQWDSYVENAAVENGYIVLNNITIMISWPNIHKI
jgi:hypothetical protein